MVATGPPDGPFQRDPPAPWRIAAKADGMSLAAPQAKPE
jgi:hypothetical protein